MSTETTELPARPRQRRLGLALVLAALVLVVLSFVRWQTGANDLTSSGTFSATLRVSMPILLAGLGGLYAERAGVVNIGLEGMMILGTWFGAWAGWHWGPWAGVLMGMAGGAAGGFLHAVATVTFGIDHIISGVAINILAAGVTWFLSLLTIAAVALIPLTWWVLWRSAFGLRLRSVGEHPVAAESLGVPVYTMKYVAVVISGALAGLAGAFLVFEEAGIYREGQTAGRGFIALAALIFGNWRPLGVGAGAGLFGYADALQLRSNSSILALLLFVSIAMAAACGWLLVRKRTGPALAVAVLAGLIFWWHATATKVANEWIAITPYVVTLAVLAMAAQRLRPPAADGRRYRKGQGETL